MEIEICDYAQTSANLSVNIKRPLKKIYVRIQ